MSIYDNYQELHFH